MELVYKMREFKILVKNIHNEYIKDMKQPTPKKESMRIAPILKEMIVSQTIEFPKYQKSSVKSSIQTLKCSLGHEDKVFSTFTLTNKQFFVTRKK